MGKKELVVINDPIPVVFKAYLNLYPDKLPDLIQLTWSEAPMTEGWGTTTFCDDGKVVIEINNKLTLEHYPEIMAHELAHVAAGLEEEHGEAWEIAFEAIFNEFNRLVAQFSKEAKENA